MSVQRKLCTEPGCTNWIPMENTYCSYHDNLVAADEDDRPEDEIIIPSEDDITDMMIAQASFPNAAALMRAAKKKGYITPTSEYVGVPVA